MKIGLIVPSSNTTMEVEFWTMASGAATVHTARTRLKNITLEELERQSEQVLDAAVALADAGVDVIGFGCTSGSLYKGLRHGLEIEREISTHTGIPAVAASSAVIDAMKALRIKKVSIVTPYSEKINKLEKHFVEKNSIKVLMIKGLGLESNRAVGDTNPDVAYNLAMEVDSAETDGIFISCTNLRTIEMIDRLENELDKPVISSNTATFWGVMKKMGLIRKLRGYGRLFI